ncbi:uncharacterized protein TNIN_199831 [Trichonephila inaurata madagascariensis]|uniref:Uncharacterized protein n=1 Tax=Trichonephila inaurata madagascariensis TaxID=2747483 RepID=A0A8X6XDJ4_9ARAC|nr:uncharacterized protein TNIN_199831 [Trichonephila inaurata madagascariensis]
MDGVSNSSQNGYLWVGLSQKYQQAFFTSRTKPEELRKSVPRRILFPFGRIMNLVKTDLASISTITWVVKALPVVSWMIPSSIIYGFTCLHMSQGPLGKEHRILSKASSLSANISGEIGSVK